MSATIPPPLPRRVVELGHQVPDALPPHPIPVSNVPTATLPQARRADTHTIGPTTEKRKLPMRTRRLLADAEQVRRAFDSFPLIAIRAMAGDPPDRYQIEYRIRGLTRGPDGKPVTSEQHVAEIQLTSEYPRQSPKCRMLTQILHPNIEPTVICVGDHWAASERLVDLIIRIGELIAYQAYNIKSPLDGEAAMWADQNSRFFPIDNRDLRPPDLA